MPMHVTQRGVNRCDIFIDDADRHHYRRLLRDACRRYGILVHAFVLMSNHVHLLLSVQEGGCLSSAMRQAGQTYVQTFNAKYRRTGPLWQGRFKSNPIDSEAYVMRVIRYIELNPVRAAMVARPESYRWSSVHMHLGGSQDPLLTPHPAYTALGSDHRQRSIAYGAWLRMPLHSNELARIRRHLSQEKRLADASLGPEGIKRA
jgi:putative transposase